METFLDHQNAFTELSNYFRGGGSIENINLPINSYPEWSEIVSSSPQDKILYNYPQTLKDLKKNLIKFNIKELRNIANFLNIEITNYTKKNIIKDILHYKIYLLLSGKKVFSILY